MKVFGVYSEENRKLKDYWFVKTMVDDFELRLLNLGASSGKKVHFASDFWFYALRRRHEYLYQAIENHPGEIILNMDCDIQFFGPCTPVIHEAMKDKDIVFQSECWPPTGEVNAGFVAIHCNQRTLDFYDRVAEMAFEKMPLGDQTAINQLLRDEPGDLRRGVFPAQIWARSHGCPPSADIIAHHANCTSGTASKIRQLKLIRRMVSAKPVSLFRLYKKFYHFRDTRIR